MTNLNSTIFSGYAQINNQRLQMAMASKVGKVNAVSSATSASSARVSADDAKFVQNFKTSMTDMVTSAEGVLNPKDSSKLAAGSSDAAVLTASGAVGKSSDSFTVSVEQLAQSQVNRSETLSSSGAQPSMSGLLRITTEKGNTDLYLSAAGAKDNKAMLQTFADKINAQNTGVTAKLAEKDGKVSLELSGAGDFAVSGSLGERLGLDQVAQAHRDAVYTVAKNGGTAERLTAKSNDVKLDSGVSLKLQGTGSATVKAGRSETDVLADAVEQMAKSFNSSLSLLNANSDRGVGVLNQMRRMILPPASEKSMAQAGITLANDGSMKFDRATFAAAMDRDAGGTRTTLNNVARGVQADAKRGLQESSYNLVSQSAASTSASKAQSYNLDTFNQLSSYNRSGVFNMMNMNAVGALLSISF